MYKILLSNNHEFFVKADTRGDAFIKAVHSKKSKRMQNTRILVINEI